MKTISFTLNITIILLYNCDLKEKNYAIGSQTVNMIELQLHYLLKALEFGNDTAVRFFHKRGKIVGEEN